jgi:acyl-coenzyme A thioesterase PaaI-like protein
VNDLAIQDRLFPDGRCFGCGPANEEGLRLKSYPASDTSVVARFTPWPQHDNGVGFLNGGIIATVLDCHSGAGAFHHAEVREWPPLPGAALPFVTAGIDLRYLRPTPLAATLDLVAEVVEASEDAMTVDVRLEHDGKVRAEATALWKRWRPRA